LHNNQYFLRSYENVNFLEEELYVEVTEGSDRALSFVHTRLNFIYLIKSPFIKAVELK